MRGLPSLRSADVSTCVVPRTFSSYGDRTFAAVHGTSPVNSLPVQLRNPDITYGLFRPQLKGHLFREAWTRRSVTSDRRCHRKTLTYLLTYLLSSVPSVLWHCWLGGRKGIRSVKNWVVGAGVVICMSELQTCIWPSWCHCHWLPIASVKSRLVLPFWYRLTWVVPDKGPLNVCVCVCVRVRVRVRVRACARVCVTYFLLELCAKLLEFF